MAVLLLFQVFHWFQNVRQHFRMSTLVRFIFWNSCQDFYAHFVPITDPFTNSQTDLNMFNSAPRLTEDWDTHEIVGLSFMPRHKFH